MLLKNLSRALRLIRILNYNSSRNCGPLSLELTLTAACNYRCYFCVEHSYLRTAGTKIMQMPENVLNSVLRDVKTLNIREVLLGGDGEPTLHTRLDDIIMSLAGRSLKIITNGSRLEVFTEKVFRRIDKLTISINSLDPDRHKLIHGYYGASQLPDILKNLKKLLDIKNGRKKTQVNYVMTADNCGELNAILKFIREYDVSVTLRPMSVWFNEASGKAMTQSQKEDVYKSVCSELEKGAGGRLRESLEHMKRSFSIEANKKFRNTLLPCYTGFYIAFIAADGTYKMCSYRNQPLGNIARVPLSEVWRDPKIQSELYKACFMRETGEAVCDVCRNCPEPETYSKLFHKYFSRMPFQLARLARTCKELSGR